MNSYEFKKYSTFSDLRKFVKTAKISDAKIMGPTVFQHLILLINAPYLILVVY